jgi:hypothetical protein
MNFETFVSETIQKKETRCWGDDYKVYEMTVAELRALAPKLATPSCQTELSEERIQGIKAAYLQYPQFFEHKTTFVVAAVVAVRQLFLMDGQHRLQFLQNEEGIPPLTLCRMVVYNIRSDQEMRDLFVDLNRDSFKNSAYLSLGIDEQRQRDALVLVLDEKYGAWFARTKRKATRLRTLVAFVEALPPALMARFSTAPDLLQHLVACNHRFLTKLGSKVEFYAEERDVVHKGQIVFPLAYCNFIEFCQHPDTTAPYYEGPRQRKAISAKSRQQVWCAEFGAAEVGKCPVCLTAVLTRVSPHGFECGHKIAHKNGGTEDVANLRPICAHCNQQMATQDWDAYVQKQAVAKTKKRLWFFS